MDHFEKLISKAGSDETLSDSERAHMRSVVSEYLAMKPVREDAPRAQAPAASGWFLLIRRPLYAACAVLLVASASMGGLAYAAEGTLPGDPLYGVKVSVTEPLRAALAANAKEEATLEMSFAERRLAEAATLANEGRLTNDTEAALTANFNAHTEAATRAVAKAGTAEDAEIATASFADRLSAYTSVLAVAKKPSDATTTSTLQLAIDDQVNALQPHHAAAMMTFAASTATPSPAPAAKGAGGNAADLTALAEATDDALRATESLIGNASSTLDASTSASVQAEFDHASALAAHGHALLEAHDEDGARAAFHDSLSATSKLEVLTRAAATLKINVFASPDSQDEATTSAASSSGVRFLHGSEHEDEDSGPDSDSHSPFGF